MRGGSFSARSHPWTTKTYSAWLHNDTGFYPNNRSVAWLESWSFKKPKPAPVQIMCMAAAGDRGTPPGPATVALPPRVSVFAKTAVRHIPGWLRPVRTRRQVESTPAQSRTGCIIRPQNVTARVPSWEPGSMKKRRQWPEYRRLRRRRSARRVRLQQQDIGHEFAGGSAPLLLKPSSRAGHPATGKHRVESCTSITREPCSYASTAARPSAGGSLRSSRRPRWPVWS